MAINLSGVKQFFAPRSNSGPAARAHAEQAKTHAALQGEVQAFMASRGLTDGFTPSAPAPRPERKGALGWLRERVSSPEPAPSRAEAPDWKKTAERMQSENDDLIARLLSPGNAAGLSARSTAYSAELHSGQQDGFFLADAAR